MANSEKKRQSDNVVQQIQETLSEYRAAHPRAEIDVYRYNSVSIRVRIVDPDFDSLDRVAREEQVWPLIEKLPEEAKADITMLVLVTPAEKKKSLANIEFEDPTPSRL